MIEYCTIDELKLAIKNLPGRTVLIVIARTGVGKTFTMLKSMSETDQTDTLLCPTIVEVERGASILKALVENSRSISMIVSPRSGGSEDDDEDEDTTEAAPSTHNLSTYGYLGLKGETTEMFVKKLKDLVYRRTVYCDELQQLFFLACTQYPLGTLYKKVSSKDGDEKEWYQQLGQCPKSARSGNCQQCFFSADRTGPHGIGFTRDFFPSLRAIEEAKPELGIAKWEDLLDPDKYMLSIGNLFIGDLPKISPMSNREIMEYLKTEIGDFIQKEYYGQMSEPDEKTEEKPKGGYADYLAFLCKMLDNPHLRMEMPLLKDAPILPEWIKAEEKRDKDVQFPKGKCFIPHVCGFNRLYLLQLFLANKMVLSSATWPDELIDMIREIARELDWDFQIKEISDLPYKFDLTVLKTGAQIGLKKIREILVGFDKLGKESFVVTDKKRQAIKLYYDCLRFINVKLFLVRDYHSGEFYRQRDEKADSRHLITYARSAICKGIDLPHKWICVIDCSHYLRRMGLPSLTPLDSREEVIGKILIELKQNLTQILGRLLRSLEPRQKGTVLDPRKIIVLLHGLPEELQDFEFDRELFYNFQAYSETFLSGNEKTQVAEVVEAISKVLQGEVPENYREKYERELAEKRAQNQLSKKQRELMGKFFTKDAKKEKKQTKLEQEVIRMAKEGRVWREVYHQKNLYRCSRREVTRLRKIFDANFS